MSASSSKKASQETAPASAPASVPTLVAFHAIPAPQGKPPILTPIGSAMAHEDGLGFTLDLQLMPTTGGRIILRTIKAQQPAAEAT